MKKDGETEFSWERVAGEGTGGDPAIPLDWLVLNGEKKKGELGGRGTGY